MSIPEQPFVVLTFGTAYSIDYILVPEEDARHCNEKACFESASQDLCSIFGRQRTHIREPITQSGGQQNGNLEANGREPGVKVWDGRCERSVRIWQETGHEVQKHCHIGRLGQLRDIFMRLSMHYVPIEL